MKKIFTLSVFVFSLYLSGCAQDAQQTDTTIQHKKTKLAKKRKKDITAQLDLSESQQKQVDNFNEDVKQKKAELFRDTSLTTEERKQELKSIKKENNKNIASVLTQDQQAKMKEIKGEKRKQRHSNSNTDGETQSSL